MGGELGLEPLVHDGATVLRSELGRYTEVGERTSIVETTMGDYSYVANDSDIIYSTIGKFCSIAAHVRINPGNHPMERASQSHFTYRASRYFAGETDEATFFDWRRSHAVTIGHDVWIGHGAVILPAARSARARSWPQARSSRRMSRLLDRRRQSRSAHPRALSEGSRRSAPGTRLVGLAARATARGASRLSRPLGRRFRRQVRVKAHPPN